MLHDIKEGRDKALRILTEKKDADLLDPDVMNLYFSYYFYSRAKKMDYSVTANQAGRKDSLLNLLSNNHLNIARTKPLQLRQSFKTAGRIFKSIDAATQAVIVEHGDGKAIVAELCAVAKEFDAKRYYGLLRQAQKYSVNVFPNIWKKLVENQYRSAHYLLDRRSE